MMTREDIMRELELLPVWKLRAAPAVLVQTLSHQRSELTPDIVTANTPEQPKSLEVSYKITISDDKKWAFICTDSLDSSTAQNALFNNILLALNINKTHVLQSPHLNDIAVSMVVLMGEAVAQSILKTDATLESLRGKVHTWCNNPLVVTYHPHDLLQHLPYKANAWDDLCLALNSLNA